MKPRSQSVNKAADFSEVPEYLVRESQNKVWEVRGGTLGKPTCKSRNKLPQSTLEAVAAFYKNDEYTRVMPGKSDGVMLQETCKSKND